MHIYCGINPGKATHISFIDENAKLIANYKIDNNPDLFAFLKKHKSQLYLIYLEECNAKNLDDKEDDSGKFALGRKFGGLLAIMEILEYDYRTISATAWQSTLLRGIPDDTTLNKRLSKKFDIYFPGVNTNMNGNSRANYGILHSMMIAEYGRRKDLIMGF